MSKPELNNTPMRECPHECPQYEDAQPELEYGEEHW